MNFHLCHDKIPDEILCKYRNHYIMWYTVNNYKMDERFEITEAPVFLFNREHYGYVIFDLSEDDIVYLKLRDLYLENVDKCCIDSFLLDRWGVDIN